MSTVLLIEDDAESRRRTAELFAREHWTAFEAGDAEAGVRLALEHKPELVLCDLLMPRTDGFQICRSIRQLLHRTKIIIVSGRDYGVDRMSAIDAGADEYIVKPIRWEKLREVIDRVLPPGSDGAALNKPIPQFIPPSTQVKFWGVRGSIPVPGSSTVGYGGNTSCIEVRAEGEIIILDAGSGLRELGIALEAEFGDRPIRSTLLISHFHWDHIQGLPFFLPAYKQKNTLRVLGYEGAQASLATALATQMETSFFPISLSDMPSAIAIKELKAMKFSIGKVKVQSHLLHHPGKCFGYRLTTRNGTISYLPDNEPYVVHGLAQPADGRTAAGLTPGEAAKKRKQLVKFLHRSDILIIDTQYTDDEYVNKVGWGHGSLSSVVSLAIDAEVRKLFLFHHDPTHDDRVVDEMVEGARMLVLESGKPIEVEAAREGAEVWLGASKLPA
jgi:phosphoribosyl 1,2-cyclic phosphodiesterase/CheY-like chemotaxis protein